MFWSSDHLTAKRPQRNNDSGLKFNSFSTDTAVINDDKETKNTYQD